MISVTSDFFDVVEIVLQMFIKEQDITKYYPYMHGLYILLVIFYWPEPKCARSYCLSVLLSSSSVINNSLNFNRLPLTGPVS